MKQFPPGHNHKPALKHTYAHNIKSQHSKMPPRKAKSDAKSVYSDEMIITKSTRRSQLARRATGKKSPYFESSSPEPQESANAKSKKRDRSPIDTVSSSGSTKRSKRPEEVFIPIRQASPGDTEYHPHKIHPNTLDFLKALAKNNDRTWFNENSGLFKGAKSDFESFIEILSKSIIAEVDDTIPELPLKDLIFRIYRDIRFSNDRTPYKTHYSAAWSRTGKKGPYACYFLSLQPGNSFIGGGLYHTEAQPLNLLRRNIDKNPRQIKSILAGGELAKEFFGVQAGGNKKKAVQAFVERNKEDALKTAPKNYPKDHKEIELLRLRSYTLGKRLSDEEVTGDDVVQKIIRIFKNMEPFISYLNSVVMPDINVESSNGEDAVASGEEDSDGN